MRNVNEINEILTTTYSNMFDVDAELFNLGVEYGQIVAKSGAQVENLDFFKIHQQRMKDKALRTSAETVVEALLLKWVKFVMIEEMENYGPLRFEVSTAANNDTLCLEEEEGYQITHFSTAWDSATGKMFLTMEVVDDLYELFKRYGVSNEFYVYFADTYRNTVNVFYDAEEVETLFSKVEICILSDINEQQLHAFVNHAQVFFENLFQKHGVV
jgi:hypothetical protein